MNAATPPETLAQQRTVGVALLLATIVGTSLLIVALHVQPAPFHQDYRQATPAQDDRVTWMLCALLILTPPLLWTGAVLALCNQCRIRLGVAVAGLAALYAAWIRLSLPYGFGDGYEHASPAQQMHLALSGMATVGWLVAALALLVAGLIARAQRPSSPPPTPPAPAARS